MTYLARSIPLFVLLAACGPDKGGSAGGGIRRYLLEKRRWLQTRPGCRHSLVVPRRAASDGEPTVEFPSLPLPFASGYRLPLARNAAARALVKLGPQLIEAGDPYRLAWAALDAGGIVGVPVIGFHHSDVPRILGRVCGPRAERLAEAYLRRLYARFTRVLAPSICMVERLRELDIQHVEHQPLGVDTRVFRPLHPLSRHRDLWRTHLGAGSGERLLVFVVVDDLNVMKGMNSDNAAGLLYLYITKNGMCKEFVMT